MLLVHVGVHSRVVQAAVRPVEGEVFDEDEEHYLPYHFPGQRVLLHTETQLDFSYEDRKGVHDWEDNKQVDEKRQGSPLHELPELLRVGLPRPGLRAVLVTLEELEFELVDDEHD
jgi:hypothetical protein